MRQAGRQLAAWIAGAAAVVALGGPAAAAEPTAMPFWQAPALPSAVIQGGAIPPGWQPQAVPYQGVGPDGRPMTMYFAPTYVFTYQSGPPVLAAPQVNRPQAPGYVQPAANLGPYGWNYRTTSVVPPAPGLPQPTVAQYRPTPYQWPADSRALAGTPIVPPPQPLVPQQQAVMPQQQAVMPPTFAAPQPWGPQQPLQPPPGQSPAGWMPSAAPPPPTIQPQPQPQAGWAAAPAVAAAAAPLGVAALATQSNPAAPPTVSLTPPVAPIPNSSAAPPISPVSSGGLAATAPKSSATANTHLWKVVGVHDGDTVTCLDENNQQQKIRLAEIDAPEVSQDYGKVSREALAGMVFGKTIQVVDDGRDRYGRWIGHLYVDGVDVNRQMVATGMAWHYAAYSKDPSLGSLQSQAQAQKLGLWAQPNPLPPWDYRKNGKKKAA
jgi:micrococcal nuclease